MNLKTVLFCVVVFAVSLYLIDLNQQDRPSETPPPAGVPPTTPPQEYTVEQAIGSIDEGELREHLTYLA